EVARAQRAQGLAHPQIQNIRNLGLGILELHDRDGIAVAALHEEFLPSSGEEDPVPGATLGQDVGERRDSKVVGRTPAPVVTFCDTFAFFLSMQASTRGLAGGRLALARPDTAVVG